MRDTVFAFFTTFIGAAGFSVTGSFVALGAMKQMSNEKSSAQCSKLEPKWLRSNAQDQSPCRFVTEPPNLLPVRICRSSMFCVLCMLYVSLFRHDLMFGGSLVYQVGFLVHQVGFKLNYAFLGIACTFYCGLVQTVA